MYSLPINVSSVADSNDDQGLFFHHEYRAIGAVPQPETRLFLHLFDVACARFYETFQFGD